MPYFQRPQGAGALGNGAYAVAIDLHRYGMGGVGDQQGAGGNSTHLHDLPHQAVGVYQGLAHEHAVRLALVDNELVTYRVRRHADQLRHQHIVAQQRRGVQQGAQAHVFRLQRRHLLRAALQYQVCPVQALVLLRQGEGGLQVFVAPVAQAQGQVGHPVDGRAQGGEQGAGGFQAVVAQIGGDQPENHEDRQQQAQTQGGLFDE